MTISSWLVLCMVFLGGAVSPGPSLLVVMRTALAQGFQAGFVMAISHAVGVGIYAAAVVYGLASLLVQSTWIFDVLRYSGAGFLLYLAWRAYASPAVADLASAANTQSPLTSSGRSNALLHSAGVGFMTAVLNPKIVFWFVALLSQFLEPSISAGEKAGIVLMAITIDGGWYVAVVLGLTRPGIRALFVEHLTWINRTFAVLLVLVAARILI